PLRRRLQAAVDRRFFRRRYDAARTLAGFAATARDEVDLGRLVERLESAVADTVQPAHVLTWLRTDDSFSARLPGDAPPRGGVGCGDPLVAYLHQAAGVVDAAGLTLESHGLECLRAKGVQLLAPLESQGELIGWLSLGPRLSDQD